MFMLAILQSYENYVKLIRIWEKYYLIEVLITNKIIVHKCFVKLCEIVSLLKY
jgi:hypothetical protein